MSAPDVAADGPFEVELRVHLIGLDGSPMEGHKAVGSITLQPGKVPTEGAIREAVREVVRQSEHFRLTTRHEFVRELLAEKVGTQVDFAVPGPDEFRLRFEEEQP